MGNNWTNEKSRPMNCVALSTLAMASVIFFCYKYSGVYVFLVWLAVDKENCLSKMKKRTDFTWLISKQQLKLSAKFARTFFSFEMLMILLSRFFSLLMNTIRSKSKIFWFFKIETSQMHTVNLTKKNFSKSCIEFLFFSLRQRFHTINLINSIFDGTQFFYAFVYLLLW